MRAALISIAGQPRNSAGDAPLAVAGRTLALRQLDLARAAGCERIIGFGGGAGSEALALQHAAEDAGLRFQSIGGAHGLLGAVRAADELLVLAPGLFAEDRRGLEQLRRGGGVLTLPAGPGVAAGFERIDLERAWAGALLVPGGLVERLADLPDDINPFAALLRIGLQARLNERALPDEVLVEGSWSMPCREEDARDLEDSWLDRHQPRGPHASLAGGAARLLLRPLAGELLARPRARSGALGVAGLAIAGAAVLAATGVPAAGFVLLALAAVAVPLCAGLAHLIAAPFGQARTAPTVALAWLVDAGLLVCGASAIEGDALHALFPPLVLVAGLYAMKPDDAAPPVSFLGDRAVLSLLLAAAAALGVAEAALMLIGLAVLVFGVIARGHNSG